MGKEKGKQIDPEIPPDEEKIAAPGGNLMSDKERAELDGVKFIGGARDAKEERSLYEQLEARCKGGGNYPGPKEMFWLGLLRKKYKPTDVK